MKYATGKSAYIQRDPKGDFICPATGCGFVTKSRGSTTFSLSHSFVLIETDLISSCLTAMAVHGKPGKCEGPAVSFVHLFLSSFSFSISHFVLLCSIPKPSRRKKGKRYKLPPPQAVAPPTVVAEEGKEPAPLPNYFGAATKSSRFLSSEFVSSSEDELEGGSLAGGQEE